LRAIKFFDSELNSDLIPRTKANGSEPLISRVVRGISPPAATASTKQAAMSEGPNLKMQFNGAKPRRCPK
jgi:hypothetical protein